MMEGDWIAMPGVPLIAAGNPEVAAGVEGDGTSAPGDGAWTAEEGDRADVRRSTRGQGNSAFGRR
jgi:hypothetical protein